MDQLFGQFEREQVDIIRKKYEKLDNSTPDNHSVTLEYDVFEKAEENGRPRQVHSVALLKLQSGSLNSLSGLMISQLTDCLDELEKWASEAKELEPRGLLIHGANHTFSTGSDLITARQTLDSGLDLAKLMQYNMARIQNLPVVSVSYVEGYALGGGAELTLATDMRVISDSAKIGFIHSPNGISIGWGGGSRLVALLGPARATELFSSGRRIGADEAIQFGLAEAKANSIGEAIAFVRAHSINSPRTSAAIKSMVNAARRLPLEAALRVEAHLFAATWGKEAHLRALNGNYKHQAPNETKQ